MPDHLLLPQPDQRGKAAAGGSLLVVKHPWGVPSFWLRAGANRERPEQIDTNGYGLVRPLDEGRRVYKDIRRYDLPLDGITISAELMWFGVGVDEYL